MPTSSPEWCRVRAEPEINGFVRVFGRIACQMRSKRSSTHKRKHAVDVGGKRSPLLPQSSGTTAPATALR